jgi:uncharacterized protein
MLINNILKDILIFCIVFMPPLVIFARFWNERGKSTWKLVVISVLYIITTLFTQNMVPFIMVMIDISMIKQSLRFYDMRYETNLINENKSISAACKDDFLRFNFSVKSFRISSAVLNSVYSYLIVIIIAVLSNIIFSFYKLNTKEQDIVSWMAALPMWKFLIMVPVSVVFAPVLEEFVFRWLLFEKILAPKVNLLIASLASSLIFAIVHFNLRSFPILFCIGIFNCYLIHEKGYWYSVFNHSIFNFVTTLALLLAKMGVVGKVV